MVTLSTNRQYLQTACESFFPFIKQYKVTRLANVAHLGTNSEQYLAANVVNCLLDEVIALVHRKMVTTSGKVIKLKMSRAQASVLLLQLMKLPVPADEFYLQQIRNEWVMQLDGELQQEALWDQFR